VIRRASIDDVDAIIQLGVTLIASGAYSHTAISYRDCINRLIKAIRSPNEWCGVAEHNGKIVGFLIMVLVPYWWSAREIYALDDGIFCVRPGLGRKLAAAGAQWAFYHGAKEVMISLTSSTNTARSALALLKRSDFSERGVVISMGLTSVKIAKKVA
jgi:hypothetical protein